MQNCPFLVESMLSGNKCRACGDGDGEPLQKRFWDYCGHMPFAKDYHDCPLYQDATGKRSNGGCYLTTACMSVQKECFDDNCKELNILRHFRDTYVKEKHEEDIYEYYKFAPHVVDKINRCSNKEELYKEMYENLIKPCCELIDKNNLEQAYKLYKEYSLNLKNKYMN